MGREKMVKILVYKNGCFFYCSKQLFHTENVQNCNGLSLFANLRTNALIYQCKRMAPNDTLKKCGH